MPKRIDNNFFYWLVGVALFLRHPIKRPIDFAKSMELIVNGIDKPLPNIDDGADQEYLATTRKIHEKN